MSMRSSQGSAHYEEEHLIPEQYSADEDFEAPRVTRRSMRPPMTRPPMKQKGGNSSSSCLIFTVGVGALLLIGGVV